MKAVQLLRKKESNFCHFILMFFIINNVRGSLYYISPGNSCPTSNSCLVLSEVLTTITADLSSSDQNVSLTLLPGNHNLVLSYTLSGLHSLTIKSSSEVYNTVTFPLIFCQYSTGLNFHSISHVYIQRIMFSGCIENEVDSVEEMIIENSTFAANSAHGRALVVTRSSVILLANNFTSFKSSLTHQSEENGGAVYCFKSNMAIVKCILSNNSASHGGAMYCVDCTTLIVNSKFTKNSASRGGALYIRRTINSQTKNTVLAKSIVYENLWETYKTNSTSELLSSLDVFCIGSTFTINNASSSGGAVYTEVNCELYLCENMFILNTAQRFGGVFEVHSSNITIYNSTLENNEAYSIGGVAYSSNSTIVINESVFCGNKARIHAGTLYINKFTNLYIHSGIFCNNTAKILGGSLYSHDRSKIFFTGNNVFTGNSALYSAVFNIYESDFQCHGTLYIINNNGTAALSHSTVALATSCNMIFTGNNGSVYFFQSEIVVNGSLTCSEHKYLKKRDTDYTLEGGALTTFISQLTINGNIALVDNKAINGGGLLSITSQITVSKYGKLSVINNTASDTGGGMYLFHSEVNVQGQLLLQENSAIHFGGGIHSISSTMVIILNRDNSYMKFDRNIARFGGGICFEDSSKVYISTILGISFSFKPIQFSENSAHFGGAIYVTDNTTTSTCLGGKVYFATAASHSECFIQILSIKLNPDNYPHLGDYFSFINNNASLGAILYGGMLDRCIIKLNSIGTNIIPYSSIPNSIEAIVNDTTSDPMRVCLCESNADLIMCDNSSEAIDVAVIKGDNLTLKVAAIDQVNRKVTATIHSSLASRRGHFGDRQQAQYIRAECTSLNFSIITPVKDNDLLSVYAEGPCNNLGISSLKFRVKFKSCISKCPIGFEPILNVKDRCVCGCHNLLKMILPFVKNSDCDSETLKVTRNKEFWISTLSYSLNGTNITSFLSYKQCPSDYCHSSTSPVYIDFSNKDGPDVQCAFNHTGVLCGGCTLNHSLSLGSSHCIECPPLWSTICIIIVVASVIAGILIVILMLFLNLTVATGTLNATIFYANVLAANKQLFMPFDKPNFHSVIIDWLNLEVGFDVCFFKGLNPYGKVWLQLIFPLYMILIVVSVIIISNHSNKFSNFIAQKNPVATLSTLILLSYSKLLHSIIGILSYATLQYTPLDGSGSFTKVVWLRDGSVDYLRGPHIPLFVVADLILVLGFLYTILLLSWQWLIKFSNKKVFCWLRSTKLISFIDAYHAPYTPKNRYWTGLLLLARVVLYLTAGINISGEPSLNLLAIFLVIACIFLLHAYSGISIYKWWSLNFIEFTTYFNILLFAAFKFYIQLVGGSHVVIAYVSISLQILVFIYSLLQHIISEFHVLEKMKHCHTNCYKNRYSLDITANLISERDYSNTLCQEVTFSEVTIKNSESQSSPAILEKENRKELTDLF